MTANCVGLAFDETTDHKKVGEEQLQRLLQSLASAGPRSRHLYTTDEVTTMTEDQILAGRIKKLVRVRFAVTEPCGRNQTWTVAMDMASCRTLMAEMCSSSTVRGSQDEPFVNLKVGQDAHYIVETGPLGRAAKVWVDDFLEMMNRTAGRLHRQTWPEPPHSNLS